MRGTISPDAVAGLDAMTRAELGELFKGLFGHPAPKGMSRPLLLRIVAYRIQEDAAGGPNRALKRRLAKLARELDVNGTVTPSPPTQIKPGTRLLRDWQGETHSVMATEAGFRYRDEPYESLSAIAREITGTRWSGPVFFGLKDRNTVMGAPNGQ
ncbi:MAG: DUF2924 domain-containing protein [Alphaproteobacteria bacterium]|nr:DUF2924 domain-containing protein [Alphaproteobacteria bacterium]